MTAASDAPRPHRCSPLVDALLCVVTPHDSGTASTALAMALGEVLAKAHTPEHLGTALDGVRCLLHYHTAALLCAAIDTSSRTPA